MRFSGGWCLREGYHAPLAMCATTRNAHDSLEGFAFHFLYPWLSTMTATFTLVAEPPGLPPTSRQRGR